jgi:2-isopropylmalate synthase
MRQIEIYDTTLRDGAQSEGVSFSVEDKLHVAQRLDGLGIHYIEGGWPGVNPKDILFFEQMKKRRLTSAKLVAFGATRKAKNSAANDPNLAALLAAQTEIITLFGKSWTLHVTDALGVSFEKNLEMIADSVGYLRKAGRRVFYDAEHFFDGFIADSDYALRTLRAAEGAGAERLILCDTNGGMMPWQVAEIVQAVRKEVTCAIGIHAHNDTEMAVANSLTAVKHGAVQVQGTINGFGERCGNANLCSIIPNLSLKMGMKSLSAAQMKQLFDVSRFVDEMANLPHNKRQAYVGDSAFAHKGGIHVHAIRKKSETYEHVLPAKVGNRQRILISDYGGTSNLLAKAKAAGIDLTEERSREVLAQLKDLEHQGFQFEGAEGSFDLLMKKAVGAHKRFFELTSFRVITEHRQNEHEMVSEATVQVNVGDHVEHTAAMGNGPVNALDAALRKALQRFYPVLKEVKLLDYKVRVLAAAEGTQAKVRVLIESGDGKRCWNTVGVSENIIEASRQALVDSIEYKLMMK